MIAGLIIGVLVLVVGVWMVWHPLAEAAKAKRERQARWAAATSWRLEGLLLPGWERALEVARRHLPGWLGGWGGVVEGRAERIPGPYGGARDGAVLDADEPRVAVVNARVIGHELWHVDWARHHDGDLETECPASWESAYLADLDAGEA